MPALVTGSQLTPRMRGQALAAFCHRYTKEHVPHWARSGSYPVQFASDQDWLAHTLFFITRDGRLATRPNHCFSTPTWPDNPELRR